MVANNLTPQEQERLEKKHKKEEVRVALNRIYKRNYSWLIVQIERLPLEIKNDIRNLRNKNRRLSRINKDIYSPFTTNYELIEELDSLIQRITSYLNISKVLYSNAFMFYILHNKIRPPAANFYINEESAQVNLSFAHAHSDEDLLLLDYFLTSRFQARPLTQTKQFNTTLFNTIDRKWKNSQTESTWQKVDRMTKKSAKNSKQIARKRSLAKQDKARFEAILREFE